MQDGISPLCSLKELAALRVERRRRGEAKAIATLPRRIEVVQIWAATSAQNAA
jgi:hypothetical protein